MHMLYALVYLRLSIKYNRKMVLVSPILVRQLVTDASVGRMAGEIICLLESNSARGD